MKLIEKERKQKNLGNSKTYYYSYSFSKYYFIDNVFKKNQKYKVSYNRLKEEYELRQDYDIEYFRDIPDEKNATPANAVFLYKFKKILRK